MSLSIQPRTPASARRSCVLTGAHRPSDPSFDKCQVTRPKPTLDCRRGSRGSSRRFRAAPASTELGEGVRTGGGLCWWLKIAPTSAGFVTQRRGDERDATQTTAVTSPPSESRSLLGSQSEKRAGATYLPVRDSSRCRRIGRLRGRRRQDRLPHALDVPQQRLSQATSPHGALRPAVASPRDLEPTV